MVGRGPAMQHLFGAIRRLAPFVRTALITGETGTGKELVARALHRAGRRSEQPLRRRQLLGGGRDRCSRASCSATSAAPSPGRRKTAPACSRWPTAASLFLDEVGELPLGVQAKLLRVLELGEVYRVGSLEPRRVDVQVLAATNRDLRVEVAAGRFRSDLFYRLNIVEVRTAAAARAPRGHRPIWRGVRARLRRAARPAAASTSPTTPRRLLATAPWDGNVRELRNVIERACLLADGGQLTTLDIAAVPAGRRRTRRLGCTRRRVRWPRRRSCRRRAAAARDGRARPHPARAAARARQQEGRGADARRQPPRALSPARAARPRRRRSSAAATTVRTVSSRRSDIPSQARTRVRSSDSIRRVQFEAVIGLEIHAQLLTRDQDLLRLQHGFGAPPEHAGLPGVSRASRCAAGPERARGGARRARRRSPSAAPSSRRRSSRARTTSIRTCRRATRSRSTSGRSRLAGRVRWECGRRGARRRASPASTWKRTPASRCTTGPEAATRHLPRLQSRRHAAGRDRHRAGHPVRGRRRRLLQPPARRA